MQADFWDVRKSNTEDKAYLIENGDVEYISTSIGFSVVVRAFYDGGWGVVSSNYDRKTEDLLKDAIRLAKISSKKANKTFLKRYETYTTPKNCLIGKMSEEEEEISLLKEIERSSRVDKRVASTRIDYKSTKLDMVYYSDDLNEEFYEMERTRYSIVVLSKDGNEHQFGSERDYIIGGSEILDGEKPYLLAKKAALTSLDLLNASSPPSGMKDVILDQNLGGVFIHEAVGHATEADLILAGNSILKDKIGEKIGSLLVNVYDDPSMKEYGHYPFDDEGIRPERRLLIKDGILVGNIHNRETASLMHGKPGNGRAEVGDVPIPRMSNTYIKNGDMNMDELLEMIGNGVYLCGSRGGEVNTGEGIFHFNAEKGYIIKDGEIGNMIKDVSLSGDTLTILKNIIGVGNDLKINGGYCGKDGQIVPVGSGSPHIAIKSVIVGGE
ncbi:MAG: TldD/PmbA family protein [Candidatus Methanoliparum thermophilum]|uniref:TldD/PmbA family protein n=1 Tax=Methanoliparum thermophilum TaxID=2491083 RepID=A0A520KQJ0_METT2|nr:TldD/PmbA family protein [Candidatus Methanoliparum sp. LAM-1]RZN63823.1 MAG: TldD/PmbA family protein [Candidatus Methanoliparum thermophilum]BDC36453.1 PmbA/TldD family protein [Candidatus Methanoliparum sp. LAM-1]